MKWNKEDVKSILRIVASEEKKDIIMIEKDFIQSSFLYYLNKGNEYLVFKGGTCLSKVFKLINRFSEDIDISISKKPTESEKRRINELIINIGNDLGLKLENKDDIKGRYSYNKYKFSYISMFDNSKYDLIVETSFYQVIDSVEYKKVCSYIDSYIEDNDDKTIQEIKQYTNFEMSVQALERTLIDKVFAICDYYLENMKERDSRHIYDICKIYNNIIIDENSFIELFNEIRIERTKHKNNPSADHKYCINDLLKDIVKTRFYENDYNTITTQLLYKYESYDDIIRGGLQKIIDSGIIKKCEENGVTK